MRAEHLQHALVVAWPHKGDALPLREESPNTVPDKVLALDTRAGADVVPECHLQIIFGSNLLAILFQVEVKIAEEPDKTRREASQLLLVLLLTRVGLGWRND